MKKTIFIPLLLLLAALLAADPNYYPLTTIAESCVTENSPDCVSALANLANVLSATHRGEFIATRLYDTGNLSSPSVADRVDHYGIIQWPTVIMNGTHTLIGVHPETVYAQAVAAKCFQPSPLKLQITSFNPASGAVTVSARLLDHDVNITGQTLMLMLVEDNVGSETNVVRQIKYQTVNIPGSGDPVTFKDSFSIDPAWNSANLWAVAAVHMNDHAILQSASTLPLPQYNIRAAMPWNPAELVTPANSSLISEPLWVFNTGSSDNMQMQLVADDAPDDWYFNYCDEEGNCYPGSGLMPLELAAGESKAFHLNLWVGSPGVGSFHFEITSANLGTFSIPFVCQAGTEVSDEVLQPSLSLAGNSPNPFRGGTSFTLNAEKSVSASIQIFDAKGRLIAETPAQNLVPGSNRIEWQAPSELPSGIYLYRLKESSAPPRRMLLIK